MRKSIVAGVLAVAASGSLGLSGTALAWDGGNTGGAGTGGDVANNCLNVGVPILSGLGVAGQGRVLGAGCQAASIGTGGNAG